MRLARRRPREAVRIEACALQATPEELKPGLAEGYLLLLRPTDVDLEGAETVLADELAQLPLRRHLDGQALDRHRLDHQSENALVQALGQQELSQAPFRIEPGRRDQKEHSLAAIGGGLQCLLPAHARHQPALGIDVEEDVVLEALLIEPVAQRERGRIVCARMADE